MGKIVFYVNGKHHEVGDELSPRLSLADYLRDVAGLTGTRLACREGGCGSCVVSVTRVDPVTHKSSIQAINSCLCPVYSCHGWQITTVEGLGSRREGLHAIQSEIVNNFGTQCGFCTPGVVMSTYSLLCAKNDPSKEDMDLALDGNLCRCTGYRSILESVRTFADKTATAAAQPPVDIEDLNKYVCPSNGVACPGTCSKEGDKSGDCHATTPVQCLQLRDGIQWLQPTSLDQLYTLLRDNGKQASIVAGDTAKGIFKEERDEKFLIDISGIDSLFAAEKSSSGLRIGGSVSISSLINIVEEQSKQEGYTYLQNLPEYLLKIGSTPIRNASSWAGNLVIKHERTSFPSDVFTALEACNCAITIGGSEGTKSVSLSGFLKESLSGKVITAVTFPPLPTNTRAHFFKVMPRATNCYAYVNAGVLLSVENNMTICAAPTIVYGGLGGANTIRASKTESFLAGKVLDESIVKEAMQSLKEELRVEEIPHGPSVAYRKEVAVNLFYKCVHQLLNPRETLSLDRPVSTGSADLQSFPEKYPLTQNVKKIEADILATGEVRYTADQPQVAGQLEAYIVTTDIAKGVIDKVDVTKALKCPGVHSVLTAKDIPGSNEYENMEYGKLDFLATTEVQYAGQPVAVVIANSYVEARAAGASVSITYKTVSTPITSVKQAVEHMQHDTPLMEESIGDVDSAFASSDEVIEGDLEIGAQHHFYLEQHSAVVSPVEDGYDVVCCAAWPEHIHTAISKFLDIPINSINMTVPRMGGSFGGKDPTPRLVVPLTALAAYKTNRPVRCVMDMSQCMTNHGIRFPVFFKYKVGVKQDGELQALSVDWYHDVGCVATVWIKGLFTGAFGTLHSGMRIPNVSGRAYAVKTDHAQTGAMRAPGQLPPSILMNTVLAHVSQVTRVDISKLIDINLAKQGDSVLTSRKEIASNTLSKVWNQLKQQADVEAWQQEVDKFNQGQPASLRRGLATSVSSWPVSGWPGGAVTAYVVIYAGDGSVAISVSAVEFGQGIYTKIAQVAAHALGVEMEKVTVKNMNTLVGANSSVTAGSKDSEYCSKSVLECCKILNERLDQMRSKKPGLGWLELLAACQEQGVNLGAHVKYNDVMGIKYEVFGAAAAEAEVDLLTGEHKINRVDVVLDFGESMNPAVDRGQIEGALIIGLGYMLQEQVTWDPDTGKMITDSTWEYKVPCAKDIPSDIRIHLLKDSPNTQGIVPAKAVGEPPILLSPVFLNAVRAAISSANSKSSFCKLDVPSTIDKIQQAAAVTEKLS